LSRQQDCAIIRHWFQYQQLINTLVLQQ